MQNHGRSVGETFRCVKCAQETCAQETYGDRVDPSALGIPDLIAISGELGLRLTRVERSLKFT